MSAPWPYEDVEDSNEPPAEPTWECPEGICECSRHQEGEPLEFSIMLCDHNGTRMPGARCRVLAHGKILNEEQPYADAQGWVLAVTRRRRETVIVEWAPSNTPPEPRYPYRSRYYVLLGEDRQREAGRRRLVNLGFSAGSDLENNVENFQRHYQYTTITGKLADILDAMHLYHDPSCLPVVRTDRPPGAPPPTPPGAKPVPTG